MSLFHSQTIFNILITLIICSAMFLFFRAKMRILEISQREQAKVLQSLVMSMRNGGHSRQDMVSDDEIMKHVQMQMQMQQGGAGVGVGAGAGAGNQNRHTNDLIDVSDDEEDDDESESSSSSSSSSSSESEDDETDSEEEDNEENEENHENTTKKIIFNNSGTLDIHSHTLEHLTGDDIKVIELSEPLYAVGGGNVSGTKDLNHHDTNDVSDDDGDDDDDDDDENASDDDDDDDEETSDDTEVKIEELPNHASLSLHQEQHLETSATDINTIEIKTIFKADKPQQQHADYNSMNVQTLKQQLKTKLSADGLQYNETAINKLNKKELIKHLTQ
jgi:hypothetical protein